MKQKYILFIATLPLPPHRGISTKRKWIHGKTKKRSRNYNWRTVMWVRSSWRPRNLMRRQVPQRTSCWPANVEKWIHSQRQWQSYKRLYVSAMQLISTLRDRRMIRFARWDWALASPLIVQSIPHTLTYSLTHYLFMSFCTSPTLTFAVRIGEVAVGTNGEQSYWVRPNFSTHPHISWRALAKWIWKIRKPQ